MDKMKIFEAMNNIGDDLVREAAEENIVSEQAAEVIESNVTVSGVETYRRITWNKIAAIASAVLLIAGVGTGGALMLKNRPPLLEEVTATTTTEAEDAATVKANGGNENAEPSTAAAVTEAATKESNNKASAEADKEEHRLTVRDEEETEALVEDRAETPQEEETEAPPVTTAKAAVQWKTSPANAQTLPKPTTVTTAVQIHYPDEKITEQTVAPDGWEWRNDIPTLRAASSTIAALNEILGRLSFQPCTCDGLPEFIFNGSDGNAYQINFTERWIWRNGCEEAYMPEEFYRYFTN